MAAREASRKRLKLSSTQAVPTMSRASATPSTSSHPVQAMASASHHTISVRQEQALKTLNTDIEAMRQLVTCKICDRLLYEPYSLSCGHTYCYSCLREWLVSNKKKTCPDCRAVVMQQPTPSYIVRELVLIFVSRSQLLPDGETSEEHHNMAKEEGKIVTDDRANTDPRTGGLFKGCFSNGRRHVAAIHDPGDAVDRCPQCHWEVEDGVCGNCEWTADALNEQGYSDYYDDEDDTEYDYFSEEGPDAVYGADGQDDYYGQDDFDGIPQLGQMAAAGLDARGGNRRNRGTIDLVSEPSSDGESDEEEDVDAGGNLRDFVVDEEGGGEDSDDDGEDTDVPQPVHSRGLGRRRGAPVVISDDEEDDGTGVSTMAHQDSASSDSEDQAPVTSWRQRQGRGSVTVGRVAARRARVASSDEESDESDGTATDPHPPPGRYGGFSSPDSESARDPYSEYDSPHDQSNPVHQYFDDGDEEDEQDESEESDSEDGWGTETPRARTYAPTSAAHRLGTLGQRSVRSANPPFTSAGQFRDSPSARPARPNGQNGRGYAEPASLAAHPFNLEDTLARTNYTQRNQRERLNANSRAGNLSRGGGVEFIHSTSFGGNSGIARRDAMTGRKRTLSIDSDDSYE